MKEYQKYQKQIITGVRLIMVIVSYLMGGFESMVMLALVYLIIKD